MKASKADNPASTDQVEGDIVEHKETNSIANHTIIFSYVFRWAPPL